MQKHKVWLSILFGLGVLLPVFFFTPVAALRDNPDQIHSNKTKRPTADRRITATSGSTRESRFHYTPTNAHPYPSRESTTVLESTAVPTQVVTLYPDEAQLVDALATQHALDLADPDPNPQGCGVLPFMVTPIGLTLFFFCKRRSKDIYL